jgi:hypothetical protein
VITARTVLGLALIEAVLLVRNLLVLAGLAAAVVLAWRLLLHAQPLWWNAAWQLGYFQMLLSAVVLIAAHLAVTRSRRDGLQELYASFPASAGTRSAAHLVALVGAIPASLVLIAAVVAIRLREAIGSPGMTSLLAGVTLVIAGGAIGVALGTRFGHPLAGLLAAFVWVAPFSQSNRYAGAETWLFPWVKPDQLGDLPGPVAGFPPAGWHAVWLAAIATLAGAVALAVTARQRAHRIGTAVLGALAVAAACVAGIVQLQPVGTGALNRLVQSIADPNSVQQCSTAHNVRYCAYPHFGVEVRAWQQAVGEVLALVPQRPGDPLTVRQTTIITLSGTALGEGHSSQQLAVWNAQLRAAPGSRTDSSTIYLAVGSWPSGAKVTTAQFQVALATAEWAVGLPASQGTSDLPCVALNQAREAVAAWLAVEATHTPTPDVNRRRVSVAIVGDAPVPTWDYPGVLSSYTIAPGPAITAAGYLLARELTTLPAAHVAQVLAAEWTTWLDPHTTQEQLAAALDVPVLNPPTLPPPPPAGNRPPKNPVCRS